MTRPFVDPLFTHQAAMRTLAVRGDRKAVGNSRQGDLIFAGRALDRGSLDEAGTVLTRTVSSDQPRCGVIDGGRTERRPTGSVWSCC
jgi:hypothetical protein